MTRTKSIRRSVRKPSPVIRLLNALVLLFGVIFLGYALGAGSVIPDVPLTAPGSIDPMLRIDSNETEEQPRDYSRFSHSNQFHSRQACMVCHRRDDNSARMRFPGRTDHLPCAGCHTLQFSDQSSPICTICHTNPQTGAMKSFPRLRNFAARFNHSRHMRVNCATCHKSLGRGVARTIPSGPSAHITCFQCHTSRSSNAMASCNTCHQPGRLVRTPESSRAFRMGFSHAKHGGNANLNCTSCHTPRPGAGRGRQMSAPLASMHFPPERTLSCGSCHNGTRAFGPNDFANCKRCHQATTFKF